MLLDLDAPFSSVPSQPVRTDTVTLIPGDGIGPEIMTVVQAVIAASGAPIAWEEREAGARVFAQGLASGVPEQTIASIRRNRVALKGPLETPVGHGGKSANVTLRKLFETYANIRPARELPGVESPFAGRGVNLVVVRENVEDLYAGIEHMQSAGVAQALKIISEKGSEKVIRAAFELARREGRRTVHCATKANILKLTEGLFKRVFEAVARDYPDIKAEHIIVDNCAHKLVLRPEAFDVIVTTNMNGDILSDLASGLVGGLGFAPSANLGDEVAIFEAVHGSAPDIAGKGLANPTAMLLAAVAMLRHLGHGAHADLIERSLIGVLDRGEARTADFARGGAAVSTEAFGEAIIRAIAAQPRPALSAPRAARPHIAPAPVRMNRRAPTLDGVDVFIESELAPRPLGEAISTLASGLSLELKMISNRGVQVYPSAGATPDCVDVYRCRFIAKSASAASDAHIIALLARIGERFRWMHVEKLARYGDEPGYTRAQAEG